MTTKLSEEESPAVEHDGLFAVTFGMAIAPEQLGVCTTPLAPEKPVNPVIVQASPRAPMSVMSPDGFWTVTEQPVVNVMVWLPPLQAELKGPDDPALTVKVNVWAAQVGGGGVVVLQTM